MGAVGSLYTKNQYLYWYIQKSNLAKIKQHLQQYPHLINEPMTRDCKSLPLGRAVWRGNLEIVQLLLKFGANINQVNSCGQTAALIASKRNRLQILKVLIQNQADVDYVSQIGLQIIEYAILGGFYDIADYLYPMIKQKKFKTAQQYRQLAIQYHYRYVNYELFLCSLESRIKPENLQDIYHKAKVILKDPVIDPRQSWKQWFFRVMDFKPAPLVQRDALPQQLQPQNRALGKIHHYLDSFVSLGSRKLQIYPQKARTEINLKALGDKDTKSENEVLSHKIPMSAIQNEL